MTDQPIDENAVLAEMATKLEADGLAASDRLAQQFVARKEDQREPKGIEPGTPYDTTCTYPEWMAQQQPAPLAYLRELVQLARESGMTHIRTGNLEMKFDPDARKTAAPAGPPVSF
jgi:hypothetical protein